MFDGVYDIVLAEGTVGHVEPQIRSQVTGAAGNLTLATGILNWRAILERQRRR